MSRVGKLPITLPKGVEVTLGDSVLTVKGPRGTLQRSVPASVDVEIGKEAVEFKRRDDSKEAPCHAWADPCSGEQYGQGRE